MRAQLDFETAEQSSNWERSFETDLRKDAVQELGSPSPQEAATKLQADKQARGDSMKHAYEHLSRHASIVKQAEPIAGEQGESKTKPIFSPARALLVAKKLGFPAVTLGEGLAYGGDGGDLGDRGDGDDIGKGKGKKMQKEDKKENKAAKKKQKEEKTEGNKSSEKKKCKMLAHLPSRFYPALNPGTP